jgi:hypothetical protein
MMLLVSVSHWIPSVCGCHSDLQHYVVSYSVSHWIPSVCGCHSDLQHDVVSYRVSHWIPTVCGCHSNLQHDVVSYRSLLFVVALVIYNMMLLVTELATGSPPFNLSYISTII